MGDGTHRRTVAAAQRSLPQLTLPAGIWLLPRSLRPALRGATGKLGAGRGPPRLPGWGVGAISLVSLVHIIQAPRSRGSRRARLQQISCCLPSILGWRLSLEAEQTGKDNQGAGQKGGGAALGRWAATSQSTVTSPSTAPGHKPRTTCKCGAGPRKVKTQVVGSGQGLALCSSPPLGQDEGLPCPTPRALLDPCLYSPFTSITLLPPSCPGSLCVSVSPVLICHPSANTG